MYFLISLKCLLRRPLVSFCFYILLTSVTIALLVGVTLTFITVRGYADAEDTYVTRVTLSKKSQELTTESQKNMTFADFIQQQTIPKDEIAPFINSRYVKESSEIFSVPVSQISLRSFNSAGTIYNVAAVVKITGIETVELANPTGNADIADRMTVVYYEPLYAFYGAMLVDSVMVFLDYDRIKDRYAEGKMPSDIIRDILEVDRAYLIKADTMFFTSGNDWWNFIKSEDVVPSDTLEKMGGLDHIITCGITNPNYNRFVPVDVSTSEEAENDPLVKRAETYPYNLADWPNGSMHMSMQLVQDLKNVKPFYNGDYVLTQGRFFSEEEIKNGTPVIIISEDTLKFSSMSIGDKVAIMLNQKNQFITDYKEYEIVGAFKSTTDYYSLTATAIGQYTKSNSVEYKGKAYIVFAQGSGNLIYLPEASIKNDPLIETYVAETRLTDDNDGQLVFLDNLYFTLKKNSDIKAFIAALESSDYIKENLDINYEDQGYSKAVESLDQLKITSAVIIITAFMVTGISAAFLMLLFVSRRSHDVIVMMALGSKKRNISGMLAWGLVVLYIVSCASGLFVGGSIIGNVIDSIVSPLYVADEFPQFALKPPPVIQPHLNTVVTESVYLITAVLLLAVLLLAFTMSIRNKLKLSPSDALSDALK